MRLVFCKCVCEGVSLRWEKPYPQRGSGPSMPSGFMLLLPRHPHHDGLFSSTQWDKMTLPSLNCFHQIFCHSDRKQMLHACFLSVIWTALGEVWDPNWDGRRWRGKSLSCICGFNFDWRLMCPSSTTWNQSNIDFRPNDTRTVTPPWQETWITCR